MHGTVEFYGVAAQVIPVLMLVLFLEHRDAHPSRHAPAHRRPMARAALMVLAACAAGETAALGGVWLGKPILYFTALVVGSLLVAISMVVAVLALPWMEVLEDEPDRRAREAPDGTRGALRARE